MTVHVRLLARGDVHVLERVAPDVFDHAVDPRWATEFLADARHHLAVAIEDGTVVGMASGVHYVHPDQAPQLFVNEVGVASTHQGRGIGTRVLQQLLQRGAALGCTEAWVLTHRENAAARRLYARAAGGDEPEECMMYTIPLLAPPMP